MLGKEKAKELLVIPHLRQRDKVRERQRGCLAWDDFVADKVYCSSSFSLSDIRLG